MSKLIARFHGISVAESPAGLFIDQNNDTIVLNEAQEQFLLRLLLLRSNELHEICNTAQAAWHYIASAPEFQPLIDEIGPPEFRDWITEFAIVVDPLWNDDFSTHVWDYEVVPVLARLWFIDQIRDPKILIKQALEELA